MDFMINFDPEIGSNKQIKESIERKILNEQVIPFKNVNKIEDQHIAVYEHQCNDLLISGYIREINKDLYSNRFPLEVRVMIISYEPNHKYMTKEMMIEQLLIEIVAENDISFKDLIKGIPKPYYRKHDSPDPDTIYIEPRLVKLRGI